jgi:hypothetical protein
MGESPDGVEMTVVVIKRGRHAPIVRLRLRGPWPHTKDPAKIHEFEDPPTTLLARAVGELCALLGISADVLTRHEPTAPATLDLLRERIVELLTRHGELTTADLIAQTHSASAQVNPALRMLLRGGAIRRLRRGRYALAPSRPPTPVSQ